MSGAGSHRAWLQRRQGGYWCWCGGQSRGVDLEKVIEFPQTLGRFERLERLDRRLVGRLNQGIGEVGSYLLGSHLLRVRQRQRNVQREVPDRQANVKPEGPAGMNMKAAFANRTIGVLRRICDRLPGMLNPTGRQKTKRRRIKDPIKVLEVLA